MTCEIFSDFDLKMDVIWLNNRTGRCVNEFPVTSLRPKLGRGLCA